MVDQQLYRLSSSMSMGSAEAPKLHSEVAAAIIIKHREDTSLLRRALEIEGFFVEEQSGDYNEVESTYPASIRCLINHAKAWKKVSQQSKYVLIVEADFVPVVGIAKLPLPFRISKGHASMAWLYSVGPVMYHLDTGCDNCYGHNAGTVAYLLDKTSASALLEIYAQDCEEYRNGEYRNWEVYYPIRLRREQGVRCYISHKMYGEHGGISNREHRAHGFRGWHEADRLAGPLHFLPMYARGSKLRYFFHRSRGWLRGVYKLVTGKYFDHWYYGWFKSANRWRKLKLVLSRLFA